MRQVTDFIKSRIFVLHYDSIEEFLKANRQIRKPTFYRKMKEGFEDAQERTKELIAIALKFREWNDLLQAYQKDDVRWGLENDALLLPVSADRQLMPDRLTVTATFDTMPPAFNLSIAAGGWIDITGEGFSLSPAQVRQGAFIIKIAGDSMEPVWHNGEMVLFHRVNLDDGPPAAGDDFLIVKNDGTGTFKRIVEVKDEQITLKAVNPKYKKPLVCSYDEVVLICWARLRVAERREG